MLITTLSGLLVLPVIQLHHIAGHDEQRRHLETFELWTQAIRVGEAVYVDRLRRAGDDLNRDIVVASVLKDDQTSMHVLEDEIER